MYPRWTRYRVQLDRGAARANGISGALPLRQRGGTFRSRWRGNASHWQRDNSVTSGDYVTFPPGEEYAHQLTNTGKTPLPYLALSTLQTTELVGYPESGKVGAANYAFDSSGKPIVRFRALFRRSSQVTDYYDGEKVD